MSHARAAYGVNDGFLTPSGISESRRCSAPRREGIGCHGGRWFISEEECVRKTNRGEFVLRLTEAALQKDGFDRNLDGTPEHTPVFHLWNVAAATKPSPTVFDHPQTSTASAVRSLLRSAWGRDNNLQHLQGMERNLDVGEHPEARKDARRPPGCQRGAAAHLSAGGASDAGSGRSRRREKEARRGPRRSC